MPDIQAIEASLSMTSRAYLRQFFEEVGHRPSAEQWDALHDLLHHYGKAAGGTLAPALYLSAIPPGTGKSAAICAFARALMDSPAHSTTGMLIACNRVTEVEDMARRLQGHRAKLCIIAADKNVDVLAMGGQEAANGAQVVIATQAALRRSLHGGAEFPDAARFHYLGTRRAVIAWDESFAFNRGVVLNGDAVGSLLPMLRRQAPAAVAPLLSWQCHLLDAPAGECQVPNFEDHGVDFRRLEEDVGDREDMVATVKALAVVSGGKACLIRNNLTGAALLTHTREIPDSLLPVIVTDASGAQGVHPAAYDQIATHRHLARLREAHKTYRNLTVRLVKRAASRTQYQDRKSTKAREHIEMCVRYIQGAAPDDVLVVSYGNRMTMCGLKERTIREAIDAKLTPDERRRVKHLTWGRHTATNSFTTVRRVVLMGLNFTPKTAHHAASGAALDKPMRTADPSQHPSPEQIEDMGRGMLRESTLQALLRGNARMGVDGDCGTMEAVIIQVPQTGLSEDEYRAMLPGAVIGYDDTLLPLAALRGNLKVLSEVVLGKLAQGEREVSNRALMEATGISASNLSGYLKHPEWRAWVDAAGLVSCLLKGRSKGLRLTGA